MQDQSFSTENFQRVWDLRTRRGENLDRFFPQVAAIAEEIRTQTSTIKARRSVIKLEDLEFDLPTARAVAALDELKIQKESVIRNHLAVLAREVNQRIDANKMQVALRESREIAGKVTYQIDPDDPASYFICRQVEANLKKSFQFQPGNRNMIAQQLFLALNNTTEKILIRTDIKAFYESIPHQDLRDILRRSPMLSRTTCRFVDSLLGEYAKVTGVQMGLPRGVGVSSALAEVFLIQLDEEFNRMPDVHLYVRYVDDIALIFGGSAHHKKLADRKSEVRNIIARINLKTNGRKSKYIAISPHDSTTEKFSYLGYEFSITKARVEVDISNQRASRYRKRLDLAFENYMQCSHLPSAGQALVDRLKFITGNTRLSNNKRHALVGIYYSNSLLHQLSPKLGRLDTHLRKCAKQANLPPSIYQRLDLLTFEQGFNTRQFFSFSPKKMRQIVKIWKYDV